MSSNEDHRNAIAKCEEECRKLYHHFKSVEVVRAEEERQEGIILRQSLVEQRDRLRAEIEMLKLDSLLDTKFLQLCGFMATSMMNFQPLDPTNDTIPQMVGRKRRQTAQTLEQLEQWMSEKIEQLDAIAEAQNEFIKRLKRIQRCEKELSREFNKFLSEPFNDES
ncbi:hypothetical protein M3Y94_00911400 [Aphelenchoides besseyi]|nr:hypothetical protein M3Y94_00911400 [Aphelenchoides besseyi]KAI6223263.1 hypothetical protein M3Y95_00871200 [Aphelenchoides besseyi]